MGSEPPPSYVSSTPSRTTDFSTSFPPVRACLFDMDGLLINSEEIYTLVTNTILRRYSRPDLPWNIKAQLQGRPGPEAGAIFYDWAKLPIPVEEYLSQQTELQKQLFPSCEPLPGVPELLKTLKESGVEMALATSSHQRNFRLKSEHLETLFSVFPKEQRVLGDDERLGSGRGKPAPYIYLLALDSINDRLKREGKKEITLAECLVFEDAVPGVEAGRRAGMRVVWVPHPGLKAEFDDREAQVLAGLCGDAKELGNVDALKGRGELKGWPSSVGDGWARYYDSLENFPYAEYGIVAKQGEAA